MSKCEAYTPDIIVVDLSARYADPDGIAGAVRRPVAGGTGGARVLRLPPQSLPEPVGKAHPPLFRG